MSAEILEASTQTLTFRITGRLKYSELKAAQQQADEAIQREGKIRLLVLVENFQGTEREGDWGDITFQSEHDPWIEKIAIVGEKRWEDLAMMFTGKGIRRIPIEYFGPAELPKARAWLAAAA